jgi:hypothetical protein
MLYIDADINGTPTKVFVDSGAQMTIISRRVAAQCGLLRLMDTQFAGMAVGVGTSRILGRVHMAPLVVRGGCARVRVGRGRALRGNARRRGQLARAHSRHLHAAPHRCSALLPHAQIGGVHFPSTFTVLENDNNDCLLGLDMLKRFQVRGDARVLHWERE